MITSSTALQNIISEISETGICAVDTEFVWERTYMPALGLIQIGANRDLTGLIDPLAPLDTAPLAALISNPQVVKILHDARQDLWILYKYCGALPTAIFDTRVAAGFCGMQSTLSLAVLHEELLGVTLSKSATRTNWLKRPLSDEQLDYAVDDVRYMPELREILLERVTARGRESWLQEELDALADPELYGDPDLREGYKRVKGAGRLRRIQLSVLRELTTWRDSLAVRLDRPRGFILRDPVLLELAESCPRDMRELRTTQTPPRTMERNGDNILKAIRDGLDLPSDQHPPSLRGERPDEATKARIEIGMETLRTVAESIEIDPAFIAPKAEISKLATLENPVEGDSRLLTGWRYEAAGQAILAAMQH